MNNTSRNPSLNIPRPPTANVRHGQPPPKFRPSQPLRATQQNPPPQASNTFHLAANNSIKPPTARPYTTEEERRIQRLLNKVLGPEYVSFRPGGGGQNVSYIEGWKALNLANEVFGFNGWSSQVISVHVDFMDLLGAGRVSLGLSVVVRITIRDGTFHEDIGYGFIENAKGKAVAFEKCKKEAFTDGLKRCLRCFGNVLGNCLYDKSIVAKMQKVRLPVPELQLEDFHRDPLVVKRETERAMKAMQRLRESETQSPQTKTTDETNREKSAHGTDARGNEGTDARGNTSESNEEGRSYHGNSNMKGSAINNGNGIDGGSHKASGNNDKSVIAASAENDTPSHELRALLVSRHVHDYDLEDFDELFEFSDDLPADGAEQEEKLHELDVELAEAQRSTESFEKSKGAEKQAAPEQVFFTSSKKAMDLQKDPELNDIPVYDHKFIATSVKRTVDPYKSQKVRRLHLPATHTPSQINSSRTGSPGLISGPNGVGKRPLGMPPSQRQPPKRLHKDVDAMEERNET